MNKKTLLYQFKISHIVANKAVEGISNEESLISPAPAGNCLNWVLGHLVLSRAHCVPYLGGKSSINPDDYNRYSQGGEAVDGHEKVISFGELMRAFNDLQDEIMAGLGSMDQAALDKKAPFSPLDDPEETIGSLIAGLLFHEAYHLGQIGLLRRVIGKERAFG